jgi:hypothetical protein
MTPDITTILTNLDWAGIAESLHTNGYALVPGVLAPELCAQMIAGYDEPVHFRKTITMERYRFGLGEYKYYSYPLPRVIQTIRETVYPHLAPVANAWMKALNITHAFPDEHTGLQQQCAAQGQVKPAVLQLKYGAGGYNTLHQDLYGDVFFPMQVVLMLNEPGRDYTGGEFVLTQQVPRAQSRAIVLQPGLGDMLIFTTNFRPVAGSRGYYRVSMKHGVSAVHSGHRHALGIIFHDAAS